VSTTNKVPGYDLTFPTTLNEMAEKDGQPPYVYGGDTVIECEQDLIDIEAGLPTRAESGEFVFQQIRNLMEDGYSQVLTREHAAEIAKYAIKLLS
jgi:hypothetical protein